MKTFLISLIFFVHFFNFIVAQESNNGHKNYFEIGLINGSYSGAYTGGVNGGAGFFFTSFGKNSALDFRAKEIYILSPEKEAGAITVTYRLYLTKGYYIGGGFAHNHEVAFDNYVDDVVGATLGNGKSIIHRSGVAIETGYDFKSLIKNRSFGIYPVTNLCLAYFVRDIEPNPLLTLSVGFRFGFKKIAQQ
ncbi:MAG: hypothetical protein K8R85_08355 [Bacteroidetes bacterium]|nr:hypothetical protein [Bacteroidota bacterium]